MNQLFKVCCSLLICGVFAACGPDRVSDVPKKDPVDAGVDAGTDAGVDAGTDAGTDAGVDAGTDAGIDPDLACKAQFSYSLPTGSVCTKDADCASGGRCIQGYGDYQFCTKACSPGLNGSDCPTDYECTTEYPSFMAAFCAPKDPETIKYLPLTKTIEAGAPCQRTDQCIEGICVAINIGSDTNVIYETFCAKECDTAKANDCGSCSQCVTFQSGKNYCVPRGGGKIGEECVAERDCNSHVCFGGKFCTSECTTELCENNAACEKISATNSICVQPTQKGGTNNGDECLLDLECKSPSRCLSNSTLDGYICRGPGGKDTSCIDNTECEDAFVCVEGTDGKSTCQPPQPIGGLCDEAKDCVADAGLSCVRFGADDNRCSRLCGTTGCGAGSTCVPVDVDTKIAIFDSATATTSVAQNDDIDFNAGNYLSDIKEFTFKANKTYFIEMTLAGGSIGNYELHLADFAQTGSLAAEIELPETTVRNDTRAKAQSLNAVHIVISASFDGQTDKDVFSFTPTVDTKVHLFTKQGAPSLCLQSGQVASTPIATACKYNFECQSGLSCDTDLAVCTKTCSIDADCGTSNSCVLKTGSTEKVCVATTTVGTIAAQTACKYDYQCKDGNLCGSLRGALKCTVPCATTACAATFECAELNRTDKPKGCVPEGTKTTVYGSCTLQSDCKSGVCTDGQCQNPCTTQTDCVGGTPTTAAAPYCTTCSTDDDCGDPNFFCEYGPGNERFCSTEDCTKDSDCPSDFYCAPSALPGFLPDVCTPKSESCRVSQCDIAQGQTTGVCKIPSSNPFEGCTTTADCLKGTCSSGVCVEACVANTDCACTNSDVTCASSVCTVAGSDTEPNDAAAQAQQLSATLPVTQYGALKKVASTLDKDLYKITLTAGTSIDILNKGLCTTIDKSFDTRMFVYASSAPTVVVVEDNKFAERGEIKKFTPTTTGDYLIEIQQENYYNDPVSKIRDGFYVLTVQVAAP